MLTLDIIKYILYFIYNNDINFIYNLIKLNNKSKK